MTELKRFTYLIGRTTYLRAMSESITSTALLKHYEQLVLNAYRYRKTLDYALSFAGNPSDQGLEMLITPLQMCRRLQWN